MMRAQAAASAGWATLARWLVGPVLWMAHFLIVYASESLVCTRGGGPETHLALVGVATAATVLALVVVTAVSWRRAARPQDKREAHVVFMDQAAVALGLFGIVAVLWTALPAIMLCACALPS